MCGRYAASRRPEDLAGLFDVTLWDPENPLPADWNVAPTKEVHAVLERPVRGEGPEPVRQLRALRWGLVPSWAKSPEGAARMINARAETVHEKTSYRRPFAARRCLIPADGYYEWITGDAERAQEEKGKRKRPRKQPYFVTPLDGSVMAFAGLYEFWRDRTLPDDHPSAWWATCTVVTTEADGEPLPEPAGDNGPRTLADIHPRMPVVLPRDRWDSWLDPARTDPEAVRPLLTGLPTGRFVAFPVPGDVSNVRNNGPDLLRRLTAPEAETLF
ncbi:SOS response-associated peptidase [Streptomyces avicenniae]|uniref:SOS response-associated peptidase n=1 Tax=Streptomyces avicenniae TaxID=500153 RepID=UPI00069C8207|nr:SOS response-associated peptidase [Streptomyces avicenniae]